MLSSDDNLSIGGKMNLKAPAAAANPTKQSMQLKARSKGSPMQSIDNRTLLDSEKLIKDAGPTPRLKSQTRLKGNLHLSSKSINEKPQMNKRYLSPNQKPQFSIARYQNNFSIENIIKI